MLRIARALGGAGIAYTKLAWWGLAAPRLTESKPLVVLQAVVTSDAGVLLAVRSDLRGWELPGGALESDEAAEAAVKREVREETGIEVSVESHVGDYIRTGFRPHVAKVYRCSYIGGRTRTNEETRDVAWFPVDAIPDTLFPWYREPLRDALLDGEAGVHREEHQGLSSILAGARIDLRMRLSADAAGRR